MYAASLKHVETGEIALFKAYPEYLFVFGIAPPPGVPVDQPLLLTFELVSMSKGKESYSMSHAEKLEAGGTKKDKANAVFKAGNFKCSAAFAACVPARTDPRPRRAKTMYEAVSKSFASESKVPSEKESANALKLACNLNG